MMKNKRILIILGIIGIFVILAVILLIIFKGHKIVTITFDTKGAKNIRSVEVEKGGSITLPTTEKEGFKFLGWFIGDIQVFNNTKFTEDTIVVAKWLDESIKTFTITFDTDGGSNVEPLIVECDKDVKFGPNPTKTGFEFVSWIDENETPILDGALLECKNITLKANWKQDEVEEPKKEETKKTAKAEVVPENKPEEKKEEVKKAMYNCPDENYVLNGTNCNLTKDASFGCDNQHEKKYNGKCYSVRTYQEATCKLQDGSTGTGSSIQPILVNGIVIYKDNTNAYCAYELQSSLSSCEGYPERIINGSSCYKRVETRPVTSVCSTEYDYIIGNALYGTVEKGTSASSGCYKSSIEHYYCENGFTLSNNKCISNESIPATITYE